MGETVHGNVDFPGDWDYFVLDLSEGETVEAKNTSSVLDLVLTFYALDRDGQIDFGAVRHRRCFTWVTLPPCTGRRGTGSYLLWAYRDSSGAPSGYVFELKPAEPDLALTYTPRGSRVRSPRAASTPIP